MSNEYLDELQQQILDLILLKNRQLRSFTRFLLDVDFLRFAETIEDLDRVFEDHYNHFQRGGGFVLPKKQIAKLTRSKNLCISKLDAFERICWRKPQSLAGKAFLQRISNAQKTFRSSFQAYTAKVEKLVHKLPDIYQAIEFQTLLQRTRFLHLIVIKNHENFQKAFYPVSVKSHCTQNTAVLKLEVLKLYRKLLTNFLLLLDDMNSGTSSSVESLRDKLNLEIDKSRDEIVIQEEEVVELRREMFPTSKVSLKEQRDTAMDHLEVRELDLEVQFKSIDALQINIQGLELQVAQLVDERQRIHEQLSVRRAALRERIREIVRLEKLVQQIEKEMSDRLFQFQQKLNELELKRLAIMQDESLTEEERAKLLAELDQEIMEVREKFEADQKLLKKECDELKELSKNVTEDVDAFKGELWQKHLDEIRELEEMKKNATPSELLLIEAKIAQLKQEFEENMGMLDSARARVQFHEDENGRYYINEKGERVYQRESGASEYIITADGHWLKVKDGFELQIDEKGEFYLDSFGNKIYTKMFYEDEYGKYYVDSEGNRIYLEASSSSEWPEYEDLSASVAVTETELSSEISEEVEVTTTRSSDEDIPDDNREQRESDVKYIQDTFGAPLRKGLALTYLHQPEDPIEFLAMFLRKYHSDQQMEAQRTELLAKVMLRKDRPVSKVKIVCKFL
ncbi:uncharacterized protein LOC131429219 [Malaya genurostris]|uniref:uncharacterized protein LOC131429219 n=1 Tax=Malaya genurostris TaxID=325434 RepID=UPI0026F3BA69|nr:uncharacterized protein LOC131429219 [Malaya genurostris]